VLPYHREIGKEDDEEDYDDDVDDDNPEPTESINKKTNMSDQKIIGETPSFIPSTITSTHHQHSSARWLL